jgi:hypothetical protein
MVDGRVFFPGRRETSPPIPLLSPALRPFSRIFENTAFFNRSYHPPPPMDAGKALS